MSFISVTKTMQRLPDIVYRLPIVEAGRTVIWTEEHEPLTVAATTGYEKDPPTVDMVLD